jgi:hypothetical protein
MDRRAWMSVEALAMLTDCGPPSHIVSMGGSKTAATEWQSNGCANVPESSCAECFTGRARIRGRDAGARLCDLGETCGAPRPAVLTGLVPREPVVEGLRNCPIRVNALHSAALDGTLARSSPWTAARGVAGSNAGTYLTGCARRPRTRVTVHQGGAVCAEEGRRSRVAVGAGASEAAKRSSAPRTQT